MNHSGALCTAPDVWGGCGRSILLLVTAGPGAEVAARDVRTATVRSSPANALPASAEPLESHCGRVPSLWQESGVSGSRWGKNTGECAAKRAAARPCPGAFKLHSGKNSVHCTLSLEANRSTAARPYTSPCLRHHFRLKDLTPGTTVRLWTTGRSDCCAPRRSVCLHACTTEAIAARFDACHCRGVVFPPRDGRKCFKVRNTAKNSKKCM